MTAIDETLIIDKDDLFYDLFNINPKKWNVRLACIKKLRKSLLIAQKFKCVYCRRPIALDEVGHRDIDHILPKSKNPEKNFDIALSKLNEYKYRRHTVGYQSFMYNPRNLALSCKICNATKGSFDPLLNRVITITSLPIGKNSYRWVHPYYDIYSDHIRISEGFIYEAITTEQGQYVITACGLDTLVGLSARILDAMILNSKDMSKAMLEISMSPQNLDLSLSAQRIYDHFQKLSAPLIENYLRRLHAADCTNLLIAALEDLRTALGTGDFVAAIA